MRQGGRWGAMQKHIRRRDPPAPPPPVALTAVTQGSRCNRGSVRDGTLSVAMAAVRQLLHHFFVCLIAGLTSCSLACFSASVGLPAPAAQRPPQPAMGRWCRRRRRATRGREGHPGWTAPCGRCRPAGRSAAHCNPSWGTGVGVQG